MPPKTKNRTTLKDVALKTGFSINTVSRALRNMQDISEETRVHIQRVATEMGYMGNTAAASLRSGYTHTIAVIVGDVSNLFHSIVTEEVEKNARRHGYSTILLNTSEDDDAEYLAIQTALNRNVDGILLCPAQQSERNTKFLKESGVPFVLFARRSVEVETDFVVGDDRLGGYLATKYLLDNGHKDILLVQGPKYNTSAFNRRLGYCDALREFKIPVREELICEVPIKGSGSQKIIGDILKKGARFTAIFAFSDLVALVLIEYLQNEGYRIPEDFSIIGFDNIQSHFPLPIRLASVDNQKTEIAAQAVAMLLKRIRADHPQEGYCQTTLETKLIGRDSVKAL
ncbi:MAG TPA: LacI family DNA-binding transcriptional regulator [Feifaniaceae bacterium]|nr:LacI family DNA-binding transcriptional regulator [Feifaniaceae bacterium]